MGNCSVAWVLLSCYAASVGLSSYGIYYFFTLPLGTPPEPPTINITAANPTTERSKYDRYYDRSYGNRHDESDMISDEDQQRLKSFGKNSTNYADYSEDPRVFVVPLCGVCILILLPLILTGLCTRKIFTSTVGLYSSVVMWGLSLAAIIIYLNANVGNNLIVPDNVDGALFLVLGGLLALSTFQVLFAVVELRQQKSGWPVLNFLHIFSLNTAFLVGRIVLGIYIMCALQFSPLWYGFRDTTQKKYFETLDYWNVPRIRSPDYICFPIQIALLYGVAVSIESLLSHLLGHLHTKMMAFTTFISCVFYGMVIIVTCPRFIMKMFSLDLYPVIMNWAIGLMFMCLIHCILSLAVKPTAMSGIPLLTDLVKNTAEVSLFAHANDFKTKAAVLRRKFKGSDTLLFNTFSMCLSSLSLILSLSSGRMYWGGTVMVIGDVVVLSRVLPAIIIEFLTQKEESPPVLKVLIQTFIEFGLLITGVAGSCPWFYGENAAAIIFNILLLILQFYNLVKNPSLRRTLQKLSESESKSVDSGITRRLVNSADDDDDDAAAAEVDPEV